MPLANHTEFENMFWLFAVAGNETLRNGLPGACLALLENPAVADELRADPCSRRCWPAPLLSPRSAARPT
jgi:cytochrome P450